MLPASFIEALTTLENEISSELFHGYGPLVIPHELDHRIEQFIDRYLAATNTERELLKTLPRDASHVLLAFAERQAAHAIRASSQEPLVRSLIAVGLAAEVADDGREGMSVLPLPWHSAELLASEPKVVFEQASALLPAKGTQALLAFCRRAPEDQTLCCMGYVAGSDQGGFRYVRTW